VTFRRIPAGYSFVGDGRLRLLVRDATPDVAPLLQRWATNTLPPARALLGGRGGVGAFQLRADLVVVLRPYRRGGLVRRFNQTRYLGVSPRPFRELRASEALRAAAVATPEVLAAAVLWDVPGCYRGALATREVPGAINLWHYLQMAAPAERGPACAAAAAVTRRMHEAGAVHPDLNLQNYLVRRTSTGWDAWIIDLDCVRLTRVTARARRAAFERICRSIRKLDPESAVMTLACVEAFRPLAEGD
jgi:tRNA A-37 threonylcarbamoyl transferase component Bud32